MKFGLPSLVASVGLALVGTAHAQDANRYAVAFPQWQSSNDSDGLMIDKFGLAGLTHYRSGLQWEGVEVQQQRYRQNGDLLDGHTLSYTAQDINPVTGLGHNWKIGRNQGLQTGLTTGELNWSQAANEQWQWGVYAGRDWVESMPALRQSVHYNLVGANVDYRIHPRVTMVGALTQTYFSDDQKRQQQRARLIWDAWPDQGVTLQWSYKRQYGEKNVAPRLYFNPERLDESMGIVGWRRRFEGWQLYARAGWGTQKIIDQDSTPARLTEINLSSPVHGQQFYKLRVGRNETIGLNGPGYVYRYADLQWIWQLDR
jgi:hypothetical protein